MTRERSIAIKIWQAVYKIWAENRQRGLSLEVLKDIEADKYKVDWKHNCWFCQYVRQDYRSVLESRKAISSRSNGCQKCPLYKYAVNEIGYIPSNNFCGCDLDNPHTVYHRAIHGASKEVQLEALDLIIRALKGEKIYESES